MKLSSQTQLGTFLSRGQDTLAQFFSQTDTDADSYENNAKAAAGAASGQTKPKVLEEHVAGKHPQLAAPEKPKDTTGIKQPPLNSEPIKKPTAGVPRPD